MPKKFFLSVSVSDLKEYLDLHVNKPISTLRSFFIEVVFLRWGGVFRLKHHLTPKKCWALPGRGRVLPSTLLSNISSSSLSPLTFKSFSSVCEWLAAAIACMTNDRFLFLSSFKSSFISAYVTWCRYKLCIRWKRCSEWEISPEKNPPPIISTFWFRSGGIFSIFLRWCFQKPQLKNTTSIKNDLRAFRDLQRVGSTRSHDYSKVEFFVFFFHRTKRPQPLNLNYIIKTLKGKWVRVHHS